MKSIITQREIGAEGPGPTMFLDVAKLPEDLKTRIILAAMMVSNCAGSVEICAREDGMQPATQFLDELCEAVKETEPLFKPAEVPPTAYGG